MRDTRNGNRDLFQFRLCRLGLMQSETTRGLISNQAELAPGLVKNVLRLAAVYHE